MSWFDDDKKDLAAGNYVAKLTNVTLDTTKKPERVSIEFTLADKQKTWLNLSFRDNMKWLTLRTCSELDVTEACKQNEATGSDPSTAVYQALCTRRNTYCELDVSYRESKGKNYQQISILGFGDDPKSLGNLAHVGAKAATGTAPELNKNDEMPF